MPMPADHIYGHIELPQHVSLVKGALRCVPVVLPVYPAPHLAHLYPPFANVPRRSVGGNMPPFIGANAHVISVGAFLPSIGTINHQVPMVPNLTQYAPSASSPKDIRRYSFPPSLPSHFYTSAMEQKNENVTNVHIQDINENKTNDTQINDTQINDKKINDKKINDEEINENRSNVEEDDKEGENKSDNDLNELDKTLDSVSSEYGCFDEEEYVYLRIKKKEFKVSNSAYNTLVHVGEGSRYCFVCDIQIKPLLLQKHVDSRSHLENMDKNRFLVEYESHLLRQVRIFATNLLNQIIVR